MSEEMSTSVFIIIQALQIMIKTCLKIPKGAIRCRKSKKDRQYNICVTNDHGYVPLVVNISRSFPRSWLITGFVTRLLRRVPLVEQELPTLSEHLSSPPVFSGVRFTRSLVLYVCLVDRCLSFCAFSFGHCGVCSSSIYGLWLTL